MQMIAVEYNDKYKLELDKEWEYLKNDKPIQSKDLWDQINYITKILKAYQDIIL